VDDAPVDDAPVAADLEVCDTEPVFEPDWDEPPDEALPVLLAPPAVDAAVAPANWTGKPAPAGTVSVKATDWSPPDSTQIAFPSAPIVQTS
jgi:hypothetical protein